MFLKIYQIGSWECSKTRTKQNATITKDMYNRLAVEQNKNSTKGQLIYHQ